LAGAADVVVWWNFSRESAPTVARQRFTSAEVKALASVGVILPDPGVEAVALARRWRRPLEQACGTLLLVCPERDLAGESLTPHPLWDEIVANLVKGPRPKTLETAHPRSSIAIAVSPRPARAVPSPTLEWHVPAGKIVRREVESPSGAGDLLGCPLKWVLGYTARLHAGRSAVLPTGNRLAGTLAHDLLAQILPDPKSTPETARKLFREQGPTLAAELFLPGAERNRAFVERVVVESARFLLRMIRDGGMRVKTVEEEYSKPALGGAFSGRTDLVLDSPLAVVDLKFAGHSYHRGALEDGTAFQLAAYAYLVAKNGNKSLPPVAYFILANQHLISTDRKAFPDADVVDGPAMADVWRAAERTYTDALERLQSGTVTAPGNGDEPPESGIDDGTFTFGAECGFCDFDAVCGQAFSEAP
jgi:hypothetical protein